MGPAFTERKQNYFMKPSLFILALFGALSIMGQNPGDLLIEYNIYDNVITYKSNGKILDKPVVNEGSNIYVKLTEFNPYLMSAELDVSTHNYSQTSGGVISSDGFDGGGGFGGIGGLFGGLNLGSQVQGNFSGIPGSRGALGADAQEAKSKFSAMTERLVEVEQKINTSYQKIQLIKNAENSKNLAFKDIESLKTNEHLRPSRIKELMEEEIHYAFSKTKGEKIDINDLVDEYDKEAAFNEALDEYKKARQDYVALLGEWQTFSAAVGRLNNEFGDLQLDFIQSKADSISFSISEVVNSKFSQEIKADLSSTYMEDHIANMSKLRQIYEEIQGNVFTYEFPPSQAVGDDVDIEIQLNRKAGNDAGSVYKTIKTRVAVDGGWKVSGGLGLAFGVLREQAYAYSVVNSVIQQDELDDFVPMVVSFAHVYRRSPSNYTIGGSFGIGIPVQGGSSIQGLSFFLGPTMVLGKQQKFLLTAGIMGAGVERLGQGFKAGDTFDSIANTLPTNRKYEFGYFIGISYDILR
jgi:hypothetical protein